jgi:hypothetical protein
LDEKRESASLKANSDTELSSGIKTPNSRKGYEKPDKTSLHIKTNAGRPGFAKSLTFRDKPAFSCVWLGLVDLTGKVPQRQPTFSDHFQSENREKVDVD